MALKKVITFAIEMEQKKRILVVDDEETLCEALRFNLDADGYETDVAFSAEAALSMDLTKFDLYILDIMMGEISGVQLAKIIKKNPATANKPIIFCTAKDTEEDIVTGLDLGADDYIVKPYSLKTMSARIRAVFRRIEIHDKPQNEDKNILEFEGIRIILDKKQCLVDGKEIKLPKKEFEILHTLMSHRGRIFSREELLKEIWPDEVVVLDRVVDVNITRIRQKLGAYGQHIVTRSGYGYGFME